MKPVKPEQGYLEAAAQLAREIAALTASRSPVRESLYVAFMRATMSEDPAHADIIRACASSSFANVENPDGLAGRLDHGTFDAIGKLCFVLGTSAVSSGDPFVLRDQVADEIITTLAVFGIAMDNARIMLGVPESQAEKRPAAQVFSAAVRQAHHGRRLLSPQQILTFYEQGLMPRMREFLQAHAGMQDTEIDARIRGVKALINRQDIAGIEYFRPFEAELWKRAAAGCVPD